MHIIVLPFFSILLNYFYMSMYISVDCLIFWVAYIEYIEYIEYILYRIYRSVARESKNMIYLEWSRESLSINLRIRKSINVSYRTDIIKRWFRLCLIKMFWKKKVTPFHTFYFWMYQYVWVKIKYLRHN